MTSKSFWIILLIVCFTTFSLTAQETGEQVEGGWTTGAGIGLDFSQLFQLNPRQGAGQNRLGLGGALNVFGNYQKGRIAWDNLGNWQFGVQRLGSGVIAKGSDEKIPFQKAIDLLRLSSKVGYKISDDSKFFYAADFSLISQLTPTYEGTEDYAGFFLSDISGQNRTPLSKLFSPATVTLSGGIDFKPNDKLSIFYSPLGAKFIIVGDDIIAARGVHGNPVEGERNPVTGLFPTFDNVDSQLGSLLRVNYADKFWEDKLTFTSLLILYSNYLNNPQNIDVDWTNELAVTLFKGLQLALTINAFYDDDVRVQISDSDSPGGVKVDPVTNAILTGKRVSITQQLLIKYNIVF